VENAPSLLELNAFARATNIIDVSTRLSCSSAMSCNFVIGVRGKSDSPPPWMRDLAACVWSASTSANHTHDSQAFSAPRVHDLPLSFSLYSPAFSSGTTERALARLSRCLARLNPLPAALFFWMVSALVFAMHLVKARSISIDQDLEANGVRSHIA